MVATFCKTLNAELVWREAFQSRAEATHAIARYIDGLYTPVRRGAGLHQPASVREAGRINRKRSPICRSKSIKAGVDSEQQLAGRMTAQRQKASKSKTPVLQAVEFKSPIFPLRKWFTIDPSQHMGR